MKKKYTVCLSGHTLENRFYQLNEDNVEFWQEKIDDREDEDDDFISDYLSCREDVVDDDFEYNFIHEGEDEFECDALIAQTESIEFDDFYVTIEDENGKEIVSIKVVDDETDEENVKLKNIVTEHDECEPFLVVQERMRGTFFEGEIELEEEFDLSKLLISFNFDLLDELCLANVTYDGKEVEYSNHSKRGKGRWYFIAQ